MVLLGAGTLHIDSRSMEECIGAIVARDIFAYTPHGPCPPPEEAILIIPLDVQTAVALFGELESFLMEKNIRLPKAEGFPRG